MEGITRGGGGHAARKVLILSGRGETVTRNRTGDWEDTEAQLSVTLGT